MPLSDPKMYPDDNGNVVVKYHHEDGTWWSEIDGWRWSCTAPTLDECRARSRSLLCFAVDERLEATSLMFMHIHETPFVKPSPTASETFHLDWPEEC